jgi:hypothetical protein
MSFKESAKKTVLLTEFGLAKVQWKNIGYKITLVTVFSKMHTTYESEVIDPKFLCTKQMLFVTHWIFHAEQCVHYPQCCDLSSEIKQLSRC